MPHSLRGRVRTTGLLLSALLAGLAVTPAGAVAADGAAGRAQAKANSAWLARRLGPDGTLQNPLGGVLPDHGLMVDTLYALFASGDGDLAAPVVSFMEQHATDYFTWDGLVPDQGFENIIVGGATAKILVAAEIAGKDTRNFGGHDMVAETQGTITRSGPDRGRVSDYAKTPDMADYVSNNANMFGQALGVIGLAGAGANDQLAIDTMLTQQCAEGFFRVFFHYVPTTETGSHVTPNGYKVSSCDEGTETGPSTPDGDATGLALSAMLAARTAGARHLDEPIDRAVAWLKGNQAANGGWGGGVGTEAPNTNSTGLIVQALADAGGAVPEVNRGVAYLKSAQATTADAGTSLGEHVGAIAYNPESYQAARTDGIAGVDTWIRASAQASLGLSQVGFYDLTQGNVPEDPGTPPPGGGDPPPAPGGKPPSADKPPVSDRAGTPPPPRAQGTNERGTVVTPANKRIEPASPTPAGSMGAYLAGMLVDGDHVEVTESGTTYTDYAATADVVLALRALGEQQKAADRASRFLLDEKSIEAYAHGAPYEKGKAAYAEPLAKLRVIAGFLRPRDTTGDIDPIMAALGTDLAALRDDGRFTDTGQLGDADDSVRRHAWAVLGLTAAPRVVDTAALIDTLVATQCADGLFPAGLDTKRCATGDVVATAVVVEAVNGRPHLVSPPSADRRDVRGANDGAGKAAPVVPDGWTAERGDMLTRATAALVVTGNVPLIRSAGTVDVVASAASVAGRQAAGLDASATARGLGALVGADGGLPAPGATKSDLVTTAAAAPGVAGRSWTSAADSPVAATVRLPLVDDVRADTVSADEPAGFSPWLVTGLVALGFLLAAALGLGGRIFRNRKNKGVTVA